MPQVVKNIGLVDWVVVTVTLWSLNIANWKITIRKWVLHQTKWAMASKTLKLPEVGIEVFVQTTCCWEEKIPETTHQCVCIEYIYILYIHIYIYVPTFRTIPADSVDMDSSGTTARSMTCRQGAFGFKKEVPWLPQLKVSKVDSKIEVNPGWHRRWNPFFTSMVLLLWMGYQAPKKAETPVKQSSPQVIEPYGIQSENSSHCGPTHPC